MLAWADIFAAIRWWSVLFLLGTAVTPLAFSLFKKLPDRGYAFVKMLSLLLVSYLFWFLGSLGFLQNNLGGILVAIALVIGLSYWAYRRTGAELRAWIWGRWQHILLTELVFALLFGLWVWVRAQNPAIVGTEKPMEFAFLNAVGRSTSFPPVDPWLSGFAISYYYFGYVMTSVLARLAAVSEPVAFNLGIAWLLAGTGVGAFGLVYNLVLSYGQHLKQAASRLALTLGLIAAIALPIAGNLQVILETLHGNGIGSAEFWAWLDVRNINGPAVDLESPRYLWWWRSSRVINEYSLSGQMIEGLEPIAEFPGFSFILGDMHPHVLALPFAFLSLAVAFLWWLEEEREIGNRRLEIKRNQSLISNPSATLRTNLQSLIPNRPLWLITVLILGGLSFLNTWDVLIHLFVVLGAFVLNRWRRFGWRNQWITEAIWLAALLVIPAVLLYLPFYLGFRSQAGAPFLLPTLVRPTRLPHFLIIFGLPLLSIWVLVLSLVSRYKFKQWKSGLVTAVTLIVGLMIVAMLLGLVVASSADGAGRILGLANELGILLPDRPEGSIAFGWGFTAVFAILPTVLSAKFTTPSVTLMLAALLGLVVMVWQGLLNKSGTQSDTEEAQSFTEEIAPPFTSSPTHLVTHSPSPLPFALLLIATGALLTLGPEFVYLRDNFGVRLNTVFKFYYQAWVMFGVAGLFGLSYLWLAARESGRKLIPAGVTVVYTAVFVGTLLFPYYAVQSRAIEFRGPVESASRQPPTLNGLAQTAAFNPDEYAAIMWLRDNVDGTPTIVEAVGGQYSAYGRISASTGIPTLLGWAGHEYQWRGYTTPEPAERDPVVRDIYTLPGWDNNNIASVLDVYSVDYIYVGHLERNTYGLDGRLPGSNKFSEQLEVAYQNGSVTIYRWQSRQ
ncbi:DUF2298 domain-containing protein [Candidatus Leptofilum sp.]|uniref:DUF2298 domain-containing protein n=1 Tax=Candidatus Leptofilum sp. TaxID=3241576 RepID=UPI003B5AD693